MNIVTFLRVTAVAVLFSSAAASHAAIKPASLFTDNAVLQQKQPIPVWGTADAHEPIVVTLNGVSQKTVADAKGAWSLRLPAVRAGGPYTLTITGTGTDTVTLNNVLIGEVWLCGGQSNMQYPLKGFDPPALTPSAIPTSGDPMLHFVNVAQRLALTPNADVRGSWQVADPANTGDLSAIGYFFGRDLRKALGVPVGLINDNWGGTPAEAWTSKEALDAVPELRHYIVDEAAYDASYPKLLDDYNAALAKYRADLAAVPPPTLAPQPPVKPALAERWNGATHMYNGMIAPIIPFGMRGAIWYQGENNGAQGYEYKTLFPTMIADWRSRWGEGNFPFLFVQLAPFMKLAQGPAAKTSNGWYELREAQRLTLTVSPNTGMAVITDLGDVKNVHPKRKEPVGDRLALIARAIVYGESIEYSGPVLAGRVVEGAKLRVKFTHAAGLRAIDVHDVSDDGPIVASSDKVLGFEIAGTDGVYYPANATIDGMSVVLSSDKVASPATVRYGWANYPIANLSNGAGLPASPFKGDDWSWGSAPK